MPTKSGGFYEIIRIARRRLIAYLHQCILHSTPEVNYLFGCSSICIMRPLQLHRSFSIYVYGYESANYRSTPLIYY